MTTTLASQPEEAELRVAAVQIRAKLFLDELRDTSRNAFSIGKTVEQIT